MALARTATERHTFYIDTDVLVITSQAIQATIVLARFVGGAPWTRLIGVDRRRVADSESSRDAIVTGQAARENFSAVTLAKSIWRRVHAHAFCYAGTNVSPTWARIITFSDKVLRRNGRAQPRSATGHKETKTDTAIRDRRRSPLGLRPAVIGSGGMEVIRLATGKTRTAPAKSLGTNRQMRSFATAGYLQAICHACWGILAMGEEAAQRPARKPVLAFMARAIFAFGKLASVSGWREVHRGFLKLEIHWRPLSPWSSASRRSHSAIRRSGRQGRT
jgi:hypothetical protein